MKKYIKYILYIAAFFAALSAFTGCASSPENAPTQTMLEITQEAEEQSAEAESEEAESEEAESEEAESEEAETPQAEETTQAVAEEAQASGSDGAKVDNEIKAKAESGARASHVTASTPKETSAPEGERIIATSPATCDIMDRLGIELVGVPASTASVIPSRYNGVTKVGTAMAPDMEIIKSLNPTDVIGPDTLKTDLEMQYNNIGVHSTFINLRSVQGLYDSVKLIGDKYGKSAEAAEIVEEYTAFMASYNSKHSGEKPKVLVLMGLPGSYLVATQNSYAGSLVELAGGENVFHDDTKDFLTINPEEMLARNPDVIIRTAHGLPKEALEMFEKEFSSNDIWKHFKAVQNNRVYDVDYMLFGMSATFDYPQALADLEPMLYGD